MQYKFVSRGGCPRVIVFFAGWAMDDVPFSGLHRPGYDILVLWDYRDLHIDWSVLDGYGEICLVAWSFGVYAASVTTVALDRRITLRIAINGTLSPVDRQLGIPPAVFRGTLEGLSERSLYKFYRRMCGSSATFAKFRECQPDRPVEELREELMAMDGNEVLQRPQLSKWDFAFIGTDDAIFPPSNQWRAWHGTPIVMLDEPHYVDFQRIIDRHVIDKDNMGAHFGKGFKSYDAQAGAQQAIVRRMEKMLEEDGVARRMQLPGARTLEIGSGTGTLSTVLDRACGDLAYLEMWDIAGQPKVQGRGRRFSLCDAEVAVHAVPSGSFDCIASASTIQWFNSPRHFLEECMRVLSGGGYLLVSTFLDGNLGNVAAATGRCLPMLTASQWRDVLPEGAEVVRFETYEDILEFDTPKDVFAHLRDTGVNSLGRNADGVPALGRAIKRFPVSLDGKCRLNYRSLIILLRKTY